jgi:hypothetical protein
LSDDTDEHLLRRLAQRDPQGSLGLDDDPELAFAGIGALPAMAELCESYQVTLLRKTGYTWDRIASWVGINAQALHKKHAKTFTETAEP